jgi:hypothetical protein
MFVFSLELTNENLSTVGNQYISTTTASERLASKNNHKLGFIQSIPRLIFFKA